jgi:putative spermidine/putrescine transport system permease protein
MATAEAREKRLILLLVSPVSLWLLCFFIFPLGILFVYSFWRFVPGGAMQPALILDNYFRFAKDWYYLKVFGQTLWIGLWVTFLSLLLSFPLAFALVRARTSVRGILYILVLSPLLTSAVVRTFGWMILLGNSGFVNRCLIATGLVHNPIKFMYTPTAIVIALTEVLLPFMVFSLEAILHNIDKSLYEAARNLGSNAVKVFFTITLPLSVPGIAAGSILVFSLAISAFVTPSLMGGPANPVMSTVIYDQALNLINWPFGAAISFALLLIITVILYAYVKLLRLGKLADILN